MGRGTHPPNVLVACLLLVGCAQSGLAQLAGGAPLAVAAQQPPATALPGPAAAPAAAVASEPAAAPLPVATQWVQRDGYVPLPPTLEEQAGAAAAAPAAAPRLPPANMFGAFTTEPPPSDPTGTNVYADPKYAPAAVRAAYEAEEAVPESVLPPATAAGAALPPPPVAAAEGVPPPAPSSASDGVFAGAGAGFSNRYVPGVGSAMSSSDLLVRMLVAAPEQQVATYGDALRAAFANATQTPASRIYVYATRTVTGADGTPSLELTLLFKNNMDVERTRQATYLNADNVPSVFAGIAARTGLRVVPGSLRLSSAVNDGGAAAGGAMALPGALPALAAPGAFGGPSANASGAAPAAAAPAASGAAGPSGAAAAALLLALVAGAALL